jgi:hypothetical protein
VGRGALNETKAAAAAISNMADSDDRTSSRGDEKSPRVPTQTLLPGNVCEMFILSLRHESFERNIFFICCIKKKLILRFDKTVRMFFLLKIRNDNFCSVTTFFVLNMLTDKR